MQRRRSSNLEVLLLAAKDKGERKDSTGTKVKTGFYIGGNGQPASFRTSKAYIPPRDGAGDWSSTGSILGMQFTGQALKGDKMIDLESFAGIYLHRGYVDMRKSINGLSIIVESEMGLELFGKYLFVFCNKRRNKLKILYWDSSGFALWYKRLEKAKFCWPKRMEEAVIKMESFQLRWLLEGYDFWKQKPHKKLRYERVN